MNIELKGHLHKRTETGQLLLPAKEPLTLLIHSVSEASSRALKSLDHTWSYLGKASQLTRNSLNALINNSNWKALGKATAEVQIRDFILRLKLLSIIGIPLSIQSVASQVPKFQKSLRWHDHEGTFLSAFSIANTSLDIFDTTTTVANAALQVLAYPSIAWISAIGIPLGLSIIGMSSVTRGIRTYHLSSFLYELEKDLIGKLERNELNGDQLSAAVTAFLESKLGPNVDKLALVQQLESQIRECKKEILERNTNSKTVKLLDYLSQVVQPHSFLTEAHSTVILNILKEVEKSVREEICLQSVNLFTNLLTATGLIMLLMAPPVSIPFILMGSAVLIKIGIQAYLDFKQENQIVEVPFHILYFRARH